MDKYLEYDGIRCHYTDEGSGDVLVFLHGFCEDLRIWEHIAPAFSASNRVICVDLPGFGESTLPDEEISISMMSGMVKAILDHEEIDRVILAGHSMGGYVSLELAANYSEYLNGLALIHSHPFGDTEEKKVHRKRVIDLIRKHGKDGFLREFYPGLVAKSRLHEYSDIIDLLKGRGAAYESAAITAALQAMIDRKDHAQTLEKIACPVLFILGREDGLFDFKVSLSQLHLPEVASVHILDKVGHLGMYESPEKIREILRSFTGFLQILDAA